MAKQTIRQVLISALEDTGRTFTTPAKIAANYGVNIKSLRKVASELRKEGLIEVTEEGIRWNAEHLPKNTQPTADAPSKDPEAHSSISFGVRLSNKSIEVAQVAASIMHNDENPDGAWTEERDGMIKHLGRLLSLDRPHDLMRPKAPSEQTCTEAKMHLANLRNYMKTKHDRAFPDTLIEFLKWAFIAAS